MARAPEPRLTYTDYLHFPDDRRWELIDGEALVTPSPSIRHQRIIGRLYRRIAEHLDLHGDGEVLVAPVDVVLSAHDVVQPDIVFVAHGRRHIITDANIQGTPDWLIEVLSDPHRDRRLKHQLYARAGVPEYWIADPEAGSVEIHLLEGGRYSEPAIVRAPDTASSRTVPGLTIDLAEAFQ